jgi:hypothetical protein
MSDTDINNFIEALLEIGANMTKNKDNEMVIRFLGSISTKVDKNEHLHILSGRSSIDLTAYGYQIVKSEIIVLPL